MNVREALSWASSELSQRTDEARLEAQVLLSHCLSWTRTQLLTHPERSLTLAEWRRYRALVKRRLTGTPLAYLVGHREFYGLDFLVDRRVLVPRPETELMVERALVLTEGSPPTGEGWLVADVGTGSGAIAISLAVHRHGALVYAIDVSGAALEVARANVARHSVADRVTLLQGDLLEPLPESVHVVLANLPYISEEAWAKLPGEVSGYEPRAALHGGADGLDAYRRLLAQSPAKLLPGGRLLLEIDPSQVSPLRELAARALGSDAEARVWCDYAGRERMMEIVLS